MSDISSIDKNLKIAEDFGREDIVLYDVLQAPFKVYGVMHEDGGFCRMPKAVAEKVNEGVAALAKNTSGGRVCFSTDSECIAISCTRENYWAMGHMARTGCGGFSLYERALAEGDGNVYFIDGAEHFASFVADECTVDGCHPNDLGFARMAEAVGEVLAAVLPKI